jgi:uncharacterized protein (DUF1684 family)
MLQRIALFATIIVFFSNCTRNDLGQAPVADNYPHEVIEWKQERVESLSDSTGWLRLAGMYWLNDGVNSFGSGPGAGIRFPEGTIAEKAGTFTLENGRVILTPASDISVTHDGKPVSDFVLYDGDEFPEVESGSLLWHVIVRDHLTGIRLYNKDNPKADEFTGFPRYEIDPKWHLKAKYFPNPEGTTVSIVNVLGQQIDAVSPGILEFKIDGDLYTLDAIENTDRMFIIIGDETNRTDTYQAGRYMYIDYPEDGSAYTIIDFNKAYNPPCAYNSFTTCQLPPMQNRLEVAITAGEKRPANWDGLESLPI